MRSLTEKEHHLDMLLPKRRLEQSPPAELMAAARAWSDEVWAKAEQSGPMSLSDGQISKGNNLAKYPVFICGVHRSGTTLVRDLLDGHPNLVVLPSEGTWYTNLESKLLSLQENERAAFLGEEWLRRLANPINQAPYWLLGRSVDTGSPYVDFARYVMAWWGMDKNNPPWPHIAIALAYASCSNSLSAKFWVDKTPTNERYLSRIRKEMPEARIIHVIRNPLATLASRKKMEPAISMRAALTDLKISFRVAVEPKNLNDEKFLLIRYEDLCETPQMLTGEMASFLNIAASDTFNQPTVAGIPSQANSSFIKCAASGQILKPDQHQQPQILSKAEQELIAAYIGDLAAKLDYPLVKVWFLRKWYLRLKHRLY